MVLLLTLLSAIPVGRNWAALSPHTFSSFCFFGFSEDSQKGSKFRRSQFLIRNFHLVAENLNKGFLSAGSRLHKLFKLLPDFGYGFLPFISGGSVVCVCCLDVFYDLVNVFMDDVIEIILSVYLCDFKGSHIKVIVSRRIAFHDALPGSFQFQIHLADTHTGDTVSDNGNVRHEPGKTFMGGKLAEQTVVDPAAS